MKEIKNPLVANIDRSNGNIEISIAKKYDKIEEGMYKSFMSVCAMDDKALVNTTEMDKSQTMKACGMQYDKMRAMINEIGKGGLTEKQKKLPPALQKAILKKMKKDGKLSKEEEEEAEAKLLSKDDQKEKEVGPEGEIKVVENPKEPKVSKAAQELPADAKKKLNKIAEELDSGVKAHASQAERIRDML
jgi:hypothetical protein